MHVISVHAAFLWENRHKYGKILATTNLSLDCQESPKCRSTNVTSHLLIRILTGACNSLLNYYPVIESCFPLWDPQAVTETTVLVITKLTESMYIQ